MKFTLISDNDYGNPKVTFEFEEDFLDEIVRNIEQFLKGSGFVFESLEVNKDALDDSSWDDDDDDDDDDDNKPTSWPFPQNGPNENNKELDLDFGEALPTLRVDSGEFKIILDDNDVHSSR